MSTSACKSCSFFETKAAVKTAGLCRFNPPSFLSEEEKQGTWPSVKSDDWCGQFDGATATH